MYRVELTESFRQRLESIEEFLAETDASHAYDTLLDVLQDTVIPNLRRFPRMGARYRDRSPHSVEAITKLASLPIGETHDLRILMSGNYLILYAVDSHQSTVHLLSIRHHRQLSFDFAGLWPGPGSSNG